jgi:hypothetical protein
VLQIVPAAQVPIARQTAAAQPRQLPSMTPVCRFRSQNSLVLGSVKPPLPHLCQSSRNHYHRHSTCWESTLRQKDERHIYQAPDIVL